MTDILSKQQRSALMSNVRNRDTKPEWILRCALHSLGFRYRLKNNHLIGRPDLAFPKLKSVVFVHGCYWHRHPGCKDASMPGSNVSFWSKKFVENVERDRRAEQELTRQGWRVFVVWECELIKDTVDTVSKVAAWLRDGSDASAPFQYDGTVADRRRLLASAERKVRHRIRTYKRVRI